NATSRRAPPRILRTTGWSRRLLDRRAAQRAASRRSLMPGRSQTDVNPATRVRRKVGALLALRHNLRPPRQELETRFVVFSQSRSGSSVLADLLDTHPEVYCATEIFRLSPP